MYENVGFMEGECPKVKDSLYWNFNTQIFALIQLDK